jgi:hypothetical protein
MAAPTLKRRRFSNEVTSADGWCVNVLFPHTISYQDSDRTVVLFFERLLGPKSGVHLAVDMSSICVGSFEGPRLAPGPLHQEVLARVAQAAEHMGIQLDVGEEGSLSPVDRRPC